jgi:hypothetical protein
MDLHAEFGPRLDEIKARQWVDPETADDIRWLVWQLESAWEFIRQDDQVIEATGQILRDVSGYVPQPVRLRAWARATGRLPC